MFFQQLTHIVGFVAGIVKLRIKCCVLFKYLSAFLACVKSATVGGASLYGRHFLTNRRSSLTPVMNCSLPTTALNTRVELDRTHLFHRVTSHQWRHNWFRIQKLNKVQAFVHVFGSNFHSKSSTSGFLNTDSIEIPKHTTSMLGLSASLLLIYTNFAI